MSSRSSYYSFKEYDVFLNFRGIDTRHGFTSHLYDALLRENYKTFMDDEELERGEAIKPGLLEAIENSRCSIAILSENYASSPSCLSELAKIVERMDTSGHIVLPVFFRVEPAHVKKLQIQSYKKEFAKYDKNPSYDFEEVQSWKDALETVCGLAGWPIEETDNEAKKIKEIIAKLSRKLHDHQNKSRNYEPRRQSQLTDVVDLDRSLKSKTVGDSNSSSLDTSSPPVIFKDPSNPNIFYTNPIPGSALPTWITNKSPKPIITIKKDPNWCKSSDSIGLALCVSLRAKPSDIFYCEMNFGICKWEKAAIFCCENQKCSDFVWLFFLARDHLPAEWLRSSYGKLKVSFHSKTSHPDTSCGACGYSFLYKEDIEMLNQIAKNIESAPSQNVDSLCSKLGFGSNDNLKVASTNNTNSNFLSQSQMSMLGCFDPYMGVNPPAVPVPMGVNPLLSPLMIASPDGIVNNFSFFTFCPGNAPPGYSSSYFSSTFSFPVGGHQMNQYWP